MVDFSDKNVIDEGNYKIHWSKPSSASDKGDTSTPPFKCSQCQETLPTLIAKKRHEKFYHFFSKPFICECGQQFGKLSEVKYHVRRVHNKEKNYVCGICNKAFFKNSDLSIHQSIHEPSAKFVCEDCGRRFRHVSNLIRHSRTHTGIKPYLCLPCNKRFSQVAALRQHEITEKHKERAAAAEGQKYREQTDVNKEENHCSEEGKQTGKGGKEKRKWWFYCKICGERFPFSVLLRDHETKHITNKDVKCNSCKIEFNSMRDFNNHACSHGSGPNAVKTTAENKDDSQERQTQNSASKDPRESDYLGEGGEAGDKDKKIELTLTQNGQIMLDNDEVLLTLNDKVYGLLLINNDVTVVENDEYLHMFNGGKGQEVFDMGPELTDIESVLNIGNLNDDITMHDGDGAIPSSDAVDPWLPDSGDGEPRGNNPPATDELSDAEKRGTNRKKHRCTECDKEFNRKSDYLKHLGTHCVRLRRHPCQECKKSFLWSSSLRNHVLKKHSKKTEYPCLRCGKIYFSSLLVEHHMKRDHLKIRSHECTVCGKAFFRRYDLKVHGRIHTDERPYICDVCGKRFRHLSHSIRHDKTHSKDGVEGRTGR